MEHEREHHQPERMWMKHPDSEGYAEVTREAFDSLWSGKGWVAAGDVDRAEVEHQRRVRQVAGDLEVDDLTKATKDVLTDVAGQLGRTVPKGATKEQILHVIEEPVSPEDGSTTTAQK